MPKLPETCPICQSEISITRFYCPNCEASTEGYFSRVQDPFSKLTKEQQDFILNFIRSEGRLNRLEEILGLSYPTLKTRLTEVIHALGFEVEKQPGPVALGRKQVLDDLEKGLISAEEALTLLQS